MAAVTKAGGTVVYDYQYSDDQFIPAGKPWAPGWLIELLGVEFFHDVLMVTRRSSRGSDVDDAHAAMAAILTFDRLARLQFTDPPPGTMIDGLDRLKALRVTLSQPAGDRPIRIGPLASVREISLDGPGVNDSLLGELAGLASLRDLRLQNTSVTGEALRSTAGPSGSRSCGSNVQASRMRTFRASRGSRISWSWICSETPA